jgi:hypothetical protein
VSPTDQCGEEGIVDRGLGSRFILHNLAEL